MEKIWYDSDRKRDDVMPNSVMVKLSNFIGLLIFVSFITGPVLDFIPWSLTPLSTALGKIRFANAVFLCHVGLLLWPLGLILFVNVLRQKRLTGLIHSTVLIGFCTWQGWGATQGVISIWERVGKWVLG